jgi:hypothetical protein
VEETFQPEAAFAAVGEAPDDGECAVYLLAFNNTVIGSTGTCASEAA